MVLEDLISEGNKPNAVIDEEMHFTSISEYEGLSKKRDIDDVSAVVSYALDFVNKISANYKDIINYEDMLQTAFEIGLSYLERHSKEDKKTSLRQSAKNSIKDRLPAILDRKREEELSYVKITDDLVADTDTPYKMIEVSERSELIEDMLNSSVFPSKADAIKMKFGLGEYDEHTNEEIGRKCNHTASRASEKIRIGLMRMRNPIYLKKLQDYRYI